LEQICTRWLLHCQDLAINNGVGAVTIGDRTRVGLSNTIIGPVTIGIFVLHKI
jgi:acetyltransferase-like isoleucine patch superfamily enzyme